MEELVSTYAERIVERIHDMLAFHYDTTGSSSHYISEVQLDCDWTESTRKTYFELAEEVQRRLKKHNIILSSTLRLHQLKESEDTDITMPFDRTMLMCYNTGRLQDYHTANSILDFDDVKPYLKQYKGKILPHTDIAYPVYGWGVAFDKEKKFTHLINSHNLDEVQNTQVQNNTTVHIREEWGKTKEIAKVQKALPSHDNTYTVILYHLDSTNLSNYSYEEIESFYSR